MVETHITLLPSDQLEEVQSHFSYPPCTPYLNKYDLTIRSTPTSGRGVFAPTPIPSQTVIEISPVLLFPPYEYSAHGKHTPLDGYTFVWRKTSSGSIMALALGLGSLFNHHGQSPNLNYSLDRERHCITYTTTRPIEQGEELQISYGVGRMLWEPPLPPVESEEHVLYRLANGYESPDQGPEFFRMTGNTDPLTLPLTKVSAWTVSIEPRNSSSAVKYLQKHSDVLKCKDDGAFPTRHLRQFKTENATIRVLICLKDALQEKELLKLLKKGRVFGEEPKPQVTEVPAIPAPTKERHKEWAQVWPCILRTSTDGLVDRAADEALWTVDRIRWATNRLKRVIQLAKGKEVPIAVHITHPYDSSHFGESWTRREQENWFSPIFIGRSFHPSIIEIDGTDQRTSLKNPLKHAVIDAVANVAALRAHDRKTANSSDYLLTGLALFTTHEPCVYCCMALIHSRVKEVYFLFPSPGRGGCCGAELPRPCEGGKDGGVYSIQEQKGLNHSYDVWRYTGGRIELDKFKEVLDVGMLDP